MRHGAASVRIKITGTVDSISSNGEFFLVDKTGARHRCKYLAIDLDKLRAIFGKRVSLIGFVGHTIDVLSFEDPDKTPVSTLSPPPQPPLKPID